MLSWYYSLAAHNLNSYSNPTNYSIQLMSRYLMTQSMVNRPRGRSDVFGPPPR